MPKRQFGNPTGSDVHIDKALSDIAIAYKNEEFVADRVFPMVSVDHQSDKYFIWDKGSWLRNSVEKRTPGDLYPEGRMKISNATYYADIFHLAYPIPDEDVKNQDDVIELEQTGAEWLAHQFMLNREVQVATDMFAGSIWDDDLTGGTDFVQWDDYENSNPVTDVDTYMEAVETDTGVTPNTLVMGRQVFNKLKEHPVLLDKFKYTQTGILNQAQIGEALGVTILVGKATRETSLEGAATATRAYVWGKHAVLLYVPASPGKRVPSAGYTFVWNIDGNGLDISISNIREDNRDRNLLKSKHAFDVKVTGSDLGVRFGSAVA
jgi:hypothetical protein